MFLFTQSGETTDTNKALTRAKEFGVRTMCVTNKIGSTIWQASDFKVDCHAGEEKSIAATKSLTSQMLCLTLVVLKYASLKNIDISCYVEQIKTLPEQLKEHMKFSRKLIKPQDFYKTQKYCYDC